MKIIAALLLLLSLCGCGYDHKWGSWAGTHLAYEAGKAGKSWEQFLETWPPNAPPPAGEERAMRRYWRKGAAEVK